MPVKVFLRVKSAIATSMFPDEYADSYNNDSYIDPARQKRKANFELVKKQRADWEARADDADSQIRSQGFQQMRGY